MAWSGERYTAASVVRVYEVPSFRTSIQISRIPPVVPVPALVTDAATRSEVRVRAGV